LPIFLIILLAHTAAHFQFTYSYHKRSQHTTNVSLSIVSCKY